MTPQAASIKEVAQRAGVSLGTVSNVLNNPSAVSASKRRRVEQAIEELGYVRNESARQLRAGHSRTLAHVVLDASNPFFTDVARGAQLGRMGAELLMEEAGASGSHVHRQVQFQPELVVRAATTGFAPAESGPAR